MVKHISIIELIIGISIIIAMSGSAIIYYGNTVENTKEAVLKKNLETLRKGIFDFYKDHGRYVKNLTELTIPTDAGFPYFVKIPIDPTTGVDDWTVVASDDSTWPRYPETDYNSVKDIQSSNTKYSSW